MGDGIPTESEVWAAIREVSANLDEQVYAEWLLDTLGMLATHVVDGHLTIHEWEGAVLLLGMATERNKWPIVRGR